MPLRVPPCVLKDSKALEAYVHKHIFPKVSAEMREYLANYFTVLFSSGWENSGGTDVTDGGAWTGTSGSPTVVETPMHHGTYAMCADAHNEYVRKSIGSVSTVYARFYIYIDSASGSDYDMFAEFVDGGGIPVMRFGQGGVTSGRPLRVVYEDGHDSYQTKTSATKFDLDTWYCVEMKLLRSHTDGEIHVWLNGEEVTDLAATGLDNDFYSAPLSFSVGTPKNYQSAVVYIDCVVVADAYIGPESTVTLKTVTDALALSDAVYRNKSLVIADTSGLTEAILQNKTLGANDLVDVNDAALTDKIVVTADAVNLAGSIFADKALQVTEAISLVETVQVGVGGAKKTKLFLIIGDFAVQLTGE